MWKPTAKIPRNHQKDTSLVQVTEFTNILNQQDPLLGNQKDLTPICNFKGEEFRTLNNTRNVEWWEKYAAELLDTIQLVASGQAEPNLKNLIFRSPKAFKAGTFSTMIPIWLVLIHQLPDPKIKWQAYQNIFYGVSVFSNIPKIPWNAPLRFREDIWLTTNTLSHGTNLHLKTNLFQTKADPEICGIRLPPLVNYPVLAPTPGTSFPEGRIRPFIQANAKNTIENGKFIRENIIKWHKTGAIEIINDPKFMPKASTAITIASKWNEQGTEIQLRQCNDAGMFKACQAYKLPCKLDSVLEVIGFLRKGDLLGKSDDKSGFHHLLFENESSQIAIQFWQGFFFRFRAAAFGFSVVPAMFQMANMTIVNFLRVVAHVPIFLYLDDRIVVQRPSSEQERLALLSGKKAPRNITLAAMLQIAAGGFISIEKSVFLPTTRLVFLGFVLDTDLETVEIPQNKWDRFQVELRTFLGKEQVHIKSLERLRGKMCSFLVVIVNMQIYIREATIMITKGDEEGHTSLPWNKHLREELELWVEKLDPEFPRFFQLSRKWSQTELIQVDPILAWTDACNVAMGIYCEELNETRTLYFDQFQAQWAIHHKEAWAIRMFLRLRCSEMRDREVLFLCDNQSVEQSFHKGSRDPLLNDIIKDINLFCIEKAITARITWVPTDEQLADAPSREISWLEEITNPELIPVIEKLIGFTFTLDAFATNVNSIKNLPFLTRYPDDTAIGTNFFSFPNLNCYRLYCFPPKPLAAATAKHLLRKATKTDWALLFHVWDAIPAWCFIEPKTKLFKVHGMASLFPSKKLDTKLGYYEPNLMAKATYLLVFRK